ncbi:MAG: hypothetical protein M3Y35_03230 [Actinomycetota bacterium]|nr:hypothetical protein [Actinomycetota bacterium]
MLANGAEAASTSGAVVGLGVLDAVGIPGGCGSVGVGFGREVLDAPGPVRVPSACPDAVVVAVAVWVMVTVVRAGAGFAWAAVGCGGSVIAYVVCRWSETPEPPAAHSASDAPKALAGVAQAAL